MAEKTFRYIIAGAGLAGTSAIDGIRELDKQGSILLIGSEQNLPYDRPPLTKKLWFGKKTVEDIFLHKHEYYVQNRVTLALGSAVISINPGNKSLVNEKGVTFRFEKLLLATGGGPRRLPVPEQTWMEFIIFEPSMIISE